MQKVSENLFRSLNVTGFLLQELLNFWFPWSSASLPWCKQLLTTEFTIYNQHCQHFQEWCDFFFSFLFARSYLKYKIKSWHGPHLPVTFQQPVETGRRIWLLLIIQRWITLKYMAKTKYKSRSSSKVSQILSKYILWMFFIKLLLPLQVKQA